jgi:hypothetical protein
MLVLFPTGIHRGGVIMDVNDKKRNDSVEQKKKQDRNEDIEPQRDPGKPQVEHFKNKTN